MVKNTSVKISSKSSSSGLFAKAILSIRSALKSVFKIKSETEIREAYFAESTDIYDLEARMRSWDNRKSASGNFTRM